MSAIVHVQNLKFKYSNSEHYALNDVTLSIPQNTSVGLLGENGAGKTTFLSCLTYQIKTFSGAIKVFDQPVHELGEKILDVGFTPQDLAIYNKLTAYENLNFFADLLKLSNKSESIARVLTFVNLQDQKNKKVQHFSGGMKRRLNMAVSLLNEPQLLILDEPTVGVDPQTRLLIFEKVEQLKQQNRTLIYSSHYMEEIERLCEYILVLSRGQLLYQGTLADLYKKMSSDKLENCYLQLMDEAKCHKS